MARACLVLAKLEAVVRSGTTEYLDDIEQIDTLNIQDLLTLADLVPLDQFRPAQQLILNPMFPAAPLVGGADADLLIDTTLVAIKTTIHLMLTSAQLSQLTGSLLLQQLGGISGMGQLLTSQTWASPSLGTACFIPSQSPSWVYQAGWRPCGPGSSTP